MGLEGCPNCEGRGWVMVTEKDKSPWRTTPPDRPGWWWVKVGYKKLPSAYLYSKATIETDDWQSWGDAICCPASPPPGGWYE